jgi:hypothetical protein
MEYNDSIDDDNDGLGGTCTAVPATPKSLTATASSLRQIDLTWTAVTPLTNCSVTYSVFRSRIHGFTPSSRNLVASGLTSASYSSTRLTDSTTYYFRVQAVNVVGSSFSSTQASATTLADRDTTPCENPITMTSGHSGNFNTTGPICLRTSASIAGWGCSSFDDRTVMINNVAVDCGEVPLPARWEDGYYYFAVSAGRFPWATLYYW